MFKEYYKKANDDIKPRHELVDEIFDKAEKKTDRNVYRYGLLAAVLILAISVFSFDEIMDFTTNEQVGIEGRELSVAPRTMMLDETAVEESKHTSAVLQEEVWTVDNYLEYLGTDIRKIALPDDIKYIERSGVIISYQNGEINSDVAEFCYEGKNGRNIKIRTSRLGVGNKNGVYEKNFRNVERLKINGVEFEITAQNMETDEMEQIVENIRKLQKE